MTLFPDHNGVFIACCGIIINCCTLRNMGDMSSTITSTTSTASTRDAASIKFVQDGVVEMIVDALMNSSNNYQVNHDCSLYVLFF